MIEFACQKCGHQMNAQQSQAGLSRICPQCKNVVFIPLQQTQPSPPAEDSDQPKINSLFTERDKLLLDLEPPKKDFGPPPESPPVSPETAEQIRLETKVLREKLGITSAGPPKPRKFPWPIDIFIYPLNLPGIIHLAVFLSLPYTSSFLLNVCPVVLHLPLVLIFMGYPVCYLAACIRDSAAGNFRAPNPFNRRLDVLDMVPQFCRLFGCFAIFWLPVIVYSFFPLLRASFTSTNEAPFDLTMFCVLYFRHDTAFAFLLSFAVLFFPMALLGVAVTGSFYAINPVSLVTSIFRTFPQYIGILCVFYGGLWAFLKAASFLSYLWTVFLVRRLLFFYLTMIMAHILGRFYWRYEERLDLEM